MRIRLPTDFDKRPLIEQLTLFAGQFRPNTDANRQLLSMLTEAAAELTLHQRMPELQPGWTPTAA